MVPPARGDRPVAAAYAFGQARAVRAWALYQARPVPAPHRIGFRRRRDSSDPFHDNTPSDPEWRTEMTDKNKAPDLSRRPAPPRQFPEPEDTELNMTPMIDIVFQLIIFFLLSLKFKTVDHRIDAMLPDTEGLDVKPVWKEDEPRIQVRVFRRMPSDPDRAYTLVKVDNAREFRLPEGWRGRTLEQAVPGRLEAYDQVLAAVQAAIRHRLAVYGTRADKLVAEIAAPPPQGGSVPHGDVTALLNAFLREGVTNVKFLGAPAPLNKRERADRAASTR